ncbi:phenylalanine--tRNA ligase beta subunit [Natronomonas pharaonis DSM 2160]|uniref:Phenylalanine--tRNA ligase beta subunit n=1 Tax=Natronomonas pharaonis (strain ATCC 35678 / DSM 2160 / CIP 103997 / JCM 8858 / NBRC 14720 / NCIMB 2260 / Gabara) TaxID=348780 RepID=SYFB_NATPD|nr:phenylalanine--tRNA ligase subunit beta [Natronomonas pharaonis]Q3ITU5.1 RecName: Full=Phenylalanine--tRNA ligase beta subunit; AltName: Full=Phenylalanyl-tRNA synthetase beta subunit; Short=PheRS [Natronomonas pharaonis DSM 2160]CAI48438.1 phenylalanine--tRNA ligase beta subunit [Natronomonas pharaonis DSM 2160]
MPVVEVDPDELRSLAAIEDKSDDELKDDLFALGLEFEGESDDGDFELEFAPDRLDRLSVEGIARSLRYQYGHDRGIDVPKTNDAEWTITVDESVPEARPYVTGAVVRGLDLDDTQLDSLIQLQEKLHATMGRNRAKGAIGVHDLTMLKGGGARSDGKPSKSITYRGVDPDGDRFVPLDDDAERTPAEVLDAHPTGETYGHLVDGLDRFPAIYDDIGLFSFPPVINGSRTEVDTGTRDLFIELTGTDQWTIDRMLAIICYALSARGGRIESVAVDYGDRTLTRPDLSTTTKTVSHDRIETTLGVDLAGTDVVDLLERSGLDAEADTEGELTYEVEIPAYRVDVLHPADIVDDVGRAFGFNELEPQYPDVSTVGGRHDRSRLEDAVRNTLVGLGFEDLLNFYMTSETELFDRMSLSPDDNAVGAREPPTITEPYSEDYTVVRTWALPSLLMVLENNTHRAYPQDLAEIGLVAGVDESKPTNVAEHRSVAGVVARTDASYEDAKARLQAIGSAFGVDIKTPPTDHPSFIDGRTAAVVIDGEPAGVIGELHPRVLVEHDLEVPVAGFEFRLDALAD